MDASLISPGFVCEDSEVLPFQKAAFGVEGSYNIV